MHKSILTIVISLVFFFCHAQVDGKKVFTSFDGTKIAYRDLGSGESVLLIHGFIVDGDRNWGSSELKKQLIAKGYRVVIPDLRGNGDSDKPKDENAYKNNAEIKDLMALMDHLEIATYGAVGYSRGSIVLAELLTEDSRIKKAVFGGMGVGFTDPNWDRRIAFADAFTGRAEPNELTKGAVEFAKSIELDLDILGYLQDHQPHTSIEELNKIKVKTLVICGDEDEENGNPKELQAQILNSRLQLVPGDHNNTARSDEFAEAVIKFLGEKK